LEAPCLSLQAQAAGRERSVQFVEPAFDHRGSHVQGRRQLCGRRGFRGDEQQRLQFDRERHFIFDIFGRERG
jgi:hypothetical protein